MQAKCRSCGAAILWVLTTAGKRMPLDATPTPDGTVSIDPGGRATVRTKDDLADVDRAAALGGPRPRLYRAHFSTCPQAAQHRRKGG